MDKQVVRQIVRQAVARHMGADPTTQPPNHPTTKPPSVHASHHLYTGLVNVSGECVIEPAVACDHCGYCKSHGH